MNQAEYRFVFDKTVALDEVAGTLRLSVLAAEALHGEAQVALDAPHHFDPRRRTCVVGAATQAGQDLAKLFGNFVRREFGAEAVRIERVAGGTRRCA